MIANTLTKYDLGLLAEIGSRLDRDVYPRVLDSGIVMPSDVTAPNPTWATIEEKNHEQQGQRRSETRSWPRSPGWQGPSSGCRPPRQAAQFVCPDLAEQYRGELTALLQAYPSTRVWWQDDGFWLLSESALLSSLQQKALFLTGIPYARERIARAWGFWSGVPLHQPAWIGPRHTNFGDGSICAFEPEERTWSLGDSLVELLDYYTVWALRQLHLQIYGRWPGRQRAHLYYERALELRCDERCACGSSKAYSECCESADRQRDRLIDAIDFFRLGGSTRRPPEAIVAFAQTQQNPPSVTDFLPVQKISYKKHVYGLNRYLNPADIYYSLTS